MENILREAPAIKALHEKFKLWRVDVEAKKDPVTGQPVLPPKPKRSWKMELCPLAYGKGILMVHFHEYVSADGRNIYVPPDVWTFEGVAPHVAPCKARSMGRARAWNQGHYYAGTAPKIGTLFMDSNYKGHVQFPVNPLWPRALWATNKMTTTAYRGELVKCKVDVEKHTMNVDFQTNLEKLELLATEKSKTKKLVRAKYRPLRYYQKVEEEWRPQFKEVLGRHKTLVILGDTGGGKTEWSMLQGKDNLDDDEETMLLVDCANSLSPDLRAWDYFALKGMVFDEGCPELMLTQKKLFQAGMYDVVMGQSSTNMYAYKIYNWRKMMIITTNSWDLSTLAPADRHWIENNTVLLDLKDGQNNPKMFLQPGEEADQWASGVGAGLRFEDVTEDFQDDLERDLAILMEDEADVGLHDMVGQ